MSMTWQKTVAVWRPGRPSFFGPVDDERIAHASSVRVLLVPLERRVSRPAPSPRECCSGCAVRRCRRGALDGSSSMSSGHPVEPAHLVEHSGRAALPGSRRCRTSRSAACRRADRLRARGSATSRPIWTSVWSSMRCERLRADAQQRGVPSRRARLHGRTPGFSAERAPSTPGGMTPRRVLACEPFLTQRHPTPHRSCPRYFSRILTCGAWCGECVAPNAR